MDRSYKRSLWVLIPFGIAVVCWFCSLPEMATSKPDHIPVSVGNLDLGEVWAQEAYPWTIPVINHTEYELKIRKVASPCGCSKVEPSSFTIPPKGTVSVLVTLDLRPRSPAESILAVRPFSVQITPLVETGKSSVRPYQFELTARVRNPLVFSASRVHFSTADNLPVQPQFVPKTAAFASAIPLKSLTAIAKPPLVSAAVTLNTEKRGTLTLVPNGELPAGYFECNIYVEATTADGETLPAVTLPVSGDVLADIQVMPPLITFAPARLSESVETTVLLVSRTGGPFSVQSVESGSEHLSIEPVTTGSMADCQYRICQRITQTGAYSQTVTFVVDREGESPDRIQLQVNHVGLSKEILP